MEERDFSGSKNNRFVGKHFEKRGLGSGTRRIRSIWYIEFKA
jgi:hypothetical protein